MSRVGLVQIKVNGFKFEVTKSVASSIDDLLKPFYGTKCQVDIDADKKSAPDMPMTSKELYAKAKEIKIQAKAMKEAEKKISKL